MAELFELQVRHVFALPRPPSIDLPQNAEAQLRHWVDTFLPRDVFHRKGALWIGYKFS